MLDVSVLDAANRSYADGANRHHMYVCMYVVHDPSAARPAEHAAMIHSRTRALGFSSPDTFVLLVTI